MKALVKLILIVALTGTAVARGEIAAELEAIRELSKQRSPRAAAGAEAPPPPPSEVALWRSEHSARLTERSLAVFEKYPGDPRRWEAALVALKTLRPFVIEVEPGYDEASAARDFARVQSLIVRDEVARTAWNERMDRLEADLFKASDVAANVLAEAYSNAVYRVSLRRGATPVERWTATRPLLISMLERVTDGSQITRTLEIASRFGPGADAAGWADLLRTASQSPNPAVSVWATGKANVEAAKLQSIDLRFTAIDGREVNLQDLRGKVVLLDFWATWCGPCKAELPNILNTYRKYHPRGFEVVAISLDNEKDRSALLDYIREQALPWPQYFDGKGWQNELATRFGIRAIPAMFLLDQEGRIASTDARGPKLESEVRRLLGLASGDGTATQTPKVVVASPVPAVELATANDSPPVPLPAVGTIAPDFVTYDLSGQPVRISDFRGKTLILDFWATWCGPCIASMPHTQEIATRYADQGVVVLAVCTGDKRKRFEDWVRLKARDYPALRFTFDPHEQGAADHAQRASWALYGVPAIPTQFIIDAEGRIASHVTGYIPGDHALERGLAAAGIKVDAASLAQPSRIMKPRAGTSGVVVVAPPPGAMPTASAPSARRTAPPFTERVGKLNAGDPVADVEFRLADGTPQRLSNYRGRPLVIFFGSAEMIPDDYLNGIVTQFGDQAIHVLAMVTRDSEASFKAWLELHANRGNKFIATFDPAPATEPRNGAINRIFQFGAPTPFTIVLDRDGVFMGMFPWKLSQGQQGLLELLRRAGVSPVAGTPPAAVASP